VPNLICVLQCFMNRTRSHIWGWQSWFDLLEKSSLTSDQECSGRTTVSRDHGSDCAIIDDKRRRPRPESTPVHGKTQANHIARRGKEHGESIVGIRDMLSCWAASRLLPLFACSFWRQKQVLLVLGGRALALLYCFSDPHVCPVGSRKIFGTGVIWRHRRPPRTPRMSHEPARQGRVFV